MMSSFLDDDPMIQGFLDPGSLFPGSRGSVDHREMDQKRLAKIEDEINSLHWFLDRMGVTRYTNSGQLSLGGRLQKLVEEQSKFSEIEK